MGKLDGDLWSHPTWLAEWRKFNGMYLSMNMYHHKSTDKSTEWYFAAPPSAGNLAHPALAIFLPRLHVDIGDFDQGSMDEPEI
jgi:hypothetical protein